MGSFLINSVRVGSRGNAVPSDFITFLDHVNFTYKQPVSTQDYLRQLKSFVLRTKKEGMWDLNFILTQRNLFLSSLKKPKYFNIFYDSLVDLEDSYNDYYRESFILYLYENFYGANPKHGRCYLCLVRYFQVNHHNLMHPVKDWEYIEPMSSQSYLETLNDSYYGIEKYLGMAYDQRNLYNFEDFVNMRDKLLSQITSIPPVYNKFYRFLLNINTQGYCMFLAAFFDVFTNEFQPYTGTSIKDPLSGFVEYHVMLNEYKLLFPGVKLKANHFKLTRYHVDIYSEDEE